MLYDTTYIWTLKSNINESMYKTETDSQTKTNVWLPKGREGAREGQILKEYEINEGWLLYIKEISNRTYCIAPGIIPNIL